MSRVALRASRVHPGYPVYTTMPDLYVSPYDTQLVICLPIKDILTYTCEGDFLEPIPQVSTASMTSYKVVGSIAQQ